MFNKMQIEVVGGKNEENKSENSYVSDPEQDD